MRDLTLLALATPVILTAVGLVLLLIAEIVFGTFAEWLGSRKEKKRDS